MTRSQRIAVLAFISVLPHWAQTPQVPAAGLEAPWDARRILTDVEKNTAEFGPLLQQLNPQQWVTSKGAPSTYILQWQTAQRQVMDVSVVANQLMPKTENLPLALDLYFRLEALDVSARALNEGVQRYADPGVAAKLSSLIARNFDEKLPGRGVIIADDAALLASAETLPEPSPTSAPN